MTKPTIVFFGFDFMPKPTPKVFLRTLLYSTSTRGQVVEGMYAKVRVNGDQQVFSFWGYGEAEKLSPGSGLYVSRNGLAANHHFNPTVDDNAYHFKPGAYEIDVVAEIVGHPKPVTLTTIKLSLSDELSAALEQKKGVLFEKTIDGVYEGHQRDR